MQLCDWLQPAFAAVARRSAFPSTQDEVDAVNQRSGRLSGWRLGRCPGGFAIGAVVVAALALSACRGGGKSAARAGDWPGYNRSPDGGRFAALDQINTGNVSRLKPVCKVKLGEEGPFQAGPIVIGDTMFITTAHTTTALNAATCAVHWRHIDSTGQQDPISVNRGAAYMDGRIFRGMPGARLAALDAASGRVIWDEKVGNLSVGEFMSSAPIAWHGTVFVGLAGGDWGIRGRVMAYDAATGRELWRFYTIPIGAERGAETWHIPATAVHGGGGTWTSYTLDTLANELFVPVGNPAPDFLPSHRPGDNLFTNSIVVLDTKSGALKWWFQATPVDGYDYDIGAPPMLYDAANGEKRVAIGSKDGFVYGLNRRTHGVVFKTPITTILDPGKPPTTSGTRACPGPLGGVEWNNPAFDPLAHRIYVGSVDWCATFTAGEAKYAPGDLYMGTANQGDSGEAATGWVTALDAATGKVLWKFHTPKPVVAGITPTSGGVIFTGDLGGNFYALDKSNGDVLLNTNTGGAIAGGVVTYMVGGRQYVATTSGNVSRSTFQTTGSPTIVVMAVDGSPLQMVALPQVSAHGLAVGASAGADSGTAHGTQIFAQFCASCHGSAGEGGAGGPNLTISPLKDLASIVAFVKNPKSPMPKLYPDPLNETDVTAVSEYVRKLQSAPEQ